METSEVVRLSKRLSYVLRHDAGSVGLTLYREGWVEVDLLLAALARQEVAALRCGVEVADRRDGLGCGPQCLRVGAGRVRA